MKTSLGHRQRLWLTVAVWLYESQTTLITWKCNVHEYLHIPLTISTPCYTCHGTFHTCRRLPQDLPLPQIVLAVSTWMLHHDFQQHLTQLRWIFHKSWTINQPTRRWRARGLMWSAGRVHVSTQPVARNDRSDSVWLIYWVNEAKERQLESPGHWGKMCNINI